MSLSKGVALFLVLAGCVRAGVVSFQGDSYPEDEDWNRYERLYRSDRHLAEGWLVQTPRIVQIDGVDRWQDDFYWRPLASFDGVEAFFLEWRMDTTGLREEMFAVSPASIVLYGIRGVLYHFTIARDQVLFRQFDPDRTIRYDIEAGVSHDYRLELYGEELYELYVDGALIDAGVPEGAYPTADSEIVFGARATYVDSVTRWDYIRFGTIPEPATGALLLSGAAFLLLRRGRRRCTR